MSTRPPYPFSAIEAKWLRTWCSAPASAREHVGQVGREDLRAPWKDSLQLRGLEAVFPPSAETPLVFESGPGRWGRDAWRLALLARATEPLSQPPTEQELHLASRFLGRVWRLCVDPRDVVAYEQACTLTADPSTEALAQIRLSDAVDSSPVSAQALAIWQECQTRVEQAIARKRPYLATAALSELANQLRLWSPRPVTLVSQFLAILQPFAPCLAHELRAKVESLPACPSSGQAPKTGNWDWPSLDSKCLTETQLEISIQINGKQRERLMVSSALQPAELEKAALSAERIIPLVRGKVIRRIVVVPGKLVNIAVG